MAIIPRGEHRNEKRYYLENTATFSGTIIGGDY